MAFKSNDINISDILKAIDAGTNQLPEFQRDWIWDDKHIISLIASISNSYPVGAVMFLEYGSNAARFKYRPFTNVSTDKTPEILVLDGQQRLTSIFCAMCNRKPVPTKTEKNKEIERYYYLNIVDCLDESIDRDDAILSIPEDKVLRSAFGHVELDLSTPEKEFENHMFPLNIVHDNDACGDWRNAYQQYYDYDKDIIKQYTRFEGVVMRTIQNYKIPVITLDKETSKEAVCQVFENVNTGGVALTVFELMTATYAADDFDLRKDWDARKEIFISKSALTPSDENSAILSGVSATDFLTATTLFSRYKGYMQNGDVAVSCKRKDVLKLTLQDYIACMDEVSKGFLRSAHFLKEQRIFSDRDLPYSTQLIPMSVLFGLLGSQAQDSTIQNKIKQWYWCGVLGEMYGGANETRYATDVTGVMAWVNDSKSEPDTVNRAFFNPTRLLSLQTRQSAAYKGIMALILFAGAQDFISGTPMDFTVFLDENTDIHHVFPKAYCEKQGIDKNRWNSIVNKTPLFARTNRMVGGKAPSVYLEKISDDNHVEPDQLDEFVSSHQIDVSLMWADDFDEFFIDRAKSLLDLISKAMGKPVSDRDSEDVVKMFGKSLTD